jgi:hypothetical protein
MSIEDAWIVQQQCMADRATRLAREEAMLMAPPPPPSPLSTGDHLATTTIDTNPSPFLSTSAPPAPLPLVVAPMGTSQHEQQCVMCHMNMLEEVPRAYENFIEALREEMHDGKTPHAAALYGQHYFAEHVQPLLDECDIGDAAPGTRDVPVYHIEVIALHLGSTIYMKNSELDNDALLTELKKTRVSIAARIFPVNPSEGIDAKAAEMNLKYAAVIFARNDKELKRPRHAHANMLPGPRTDAESMSPALRRQRRRPPAINTTSTMGAWMDRQMEPHSSVPPT